MRQSHLLKRQQARESVVERAAEQTITQYMVDMFIIALNDPEVMGKDVLGYKRLSKVVQAVQNYWDIFSGAMSHKNVEADYLREKLDERLRGIIPPEHFTPFLERYRYLEDVRYEKRK